MMALQANFGLDWSAIAGSGFVVGVLFLALVERLRRTFATRQELGGVEDKLKLLESRYLEAMRFAAGAVQRARAVEAEQKRQAERISEQVLRPLERAVEKLDALSEVQATQALVLEYLERRLDRMEVGSGAEPVR